MFFSDGSIAVSCMIHLTEDSTSTANDLLAHVEMAIGMSSVLFNVIDGSLVVDDPGKLSLVIGAKTHVTRRDT